MDRPVEEMLDFPHLGTVGMFDAEYPEILSTIPNPPAVLWFRGDLRHRLRNVAIVGTRQPTEFGRTITATVEPFGVASAVWLDQGRSQGESRLKTSSRRRALARLAILLLSGFFLLGSTVAATAHSGSQSYVYLDVFDSTIEGRIEYPVADLNEVLGLNIPNNVDGALEGAEANLGTIQAYSAAHLALADPAGTEWPLVFGGVESLEVGNGAYVILDFAVDQEFSSVPRQFVAAYDGIIHAKPERDALLIIGTDWGTGRFDNEASELLRYTASNTVQTVDLGSSSFWSGLTGVIGLGVEHIRIGTDHILFIFALVLPAVLVFTRMSGWQPSPSFGASLWRVLKIVTMFTVAHTITLTLGGLGIVEFPPALVETVIAISIALAALHNIRPVFVNREWLIAFGFGLFHGFGFAGLLSDLGLTQSRQFVSLLGFNLGIEIGQALIILLIFPALFLARRTRLYLPAMHVGSVLLITIAGAWALDRAVGIDLNVDRIVDRVVLWPRSLWFIGLTYAGAILLYLFDRNQGELLPVASEEVPSSSEVAVPAAEG